MEASRSTLQESPTRGNPDRMSVQKFANYHDEYDPFSENEQRLKSSYDVMKESTNQDVDTMNPEARVLHYTACINNVSKDIKLGGLVGIHEMLRTEELSNEIVEVILGEVLTAIEHWEEQDMEFLECALEIVSIIGPHDFTISYIPLLTSMVVHNQPSEMEPIHTAAYNCLMSIGVPGLDALIELARKDYEYFQEWLLDKLALNYGIQKHIIVPALVNDAQSQDIRLRTQAVAALNRMYTLVWQGGALPVLLALMQEGTVDRQLIACTIRSCGQIGETTLIKLLKQSDNPKVRMAAASALCWRVPNRPQQLDIHIVHSDAIIDNQALPGSLCYYAVPLIPVVFQEDDDSGRLELNARDFIASLQRFVRQESSGEKGNLFMNMSSMPDINDEQEEEKSSVSIQSINALVYGLKDEYEGVRETAAYSLGLIGLPEGADAATGLINSLKDQSAQVRTTAAWAVGRIGPAAWKAGPILIEMLKDGYWKVRTSACIALATAGQQVAEKAISALSRMMKDGSINRDNVAETIVRLGPSGEQLLIEMLNSQPVTNFKLRKGIVHALSQANSDHNNIDFVIETLFKTAGDSMAQVRKECLESLQILHHRAKQAGQVTFLKPNTLLPFYFKFLKDKDRSVRMTALQNIVEFGAQGQLMFIEGLTKDENPQVRSICATGLGSYGPITIRTLLFGLHDPNPQVRKSTAKTIETNFTLDNISECFWDKIAQRLSLKCTIKEVLNLPYTLPQTCANMMKELVQLFDAEFKPGNRGAQYLEEHTELTN